jgi:sialidase-1
MPEFRVQMEERFNCETAATDPEAPRPFPGRSIRRAGTLLGGLLLCAAGWGASFTQVEVFRAGEGGYHTYRIPALITTPKGTLLAFCEGRRNSASDTGDIDLLLRRSFDGGKTWGPVQKLADKREDTIGNPAPVVERKTGTIFLLMTSNPGNSGEKEITRGDYRAARSIWIIRSKDDGATWSEPVEITSQVKRPDWTWYATGPGNGIQLRTGRLVIACDHNRREGDVRHSHVIYSDDRGETWKIGGVAEDKTNESAVAELKDGELMLNMRSYHGKNRRAVQRSRDGGLTWFALQLDDALIEPVCQASLVAAVPAGKKSNGRLLFSNPAAATRTRMTVRLSEDDGRTWAASRLVHAGPSAYSSLAVLPDRTIGLLYERGDERPYERITFAHFDLKWIKTEVDQKRN